MEEGRLFRCKIDRHNLFTYQARESSLIPVGFLTAQFLQKLSIMKHLFRLGNSVEPCSIAFHNKSEAVNAILSIYIEENCFNQFISISKINRCQFATIAF